MLIELRRISEDTLERVERARKAQHDFDADKYLAKTRAEIKKVIFPNIEPRTPSVKAESTPPAAISEPVVVKPKPESQMVVQRESVEVEKRTQKFTSFFDEIG
jgi:cell division initiation protein